MIPYHTQYLLRCFTQVFHKPVVIAIDASEYHITLVVHDPYKCILLIIVLFYSAAIARYGFS